jgi:3-oxoacyl-[acyl-carrier protein] reductase
MIRANSVSPGNTYFPGGVWAFLASPAASFISGTNLVVDGALTKGVQF